MWTPNDSNFNEFIRAALTKLGDTVIDTTDVLEKVAKASGLKVKDDKDGRFSKD